MKIENARIRSTTLGYEDHGIFTCMLYLDREIGEQGFGGYGLTMVGTDYGLKFIQEILNTVGVDNWEDLRGKYIRIAVGEQWNDSIKGIGNVIKDKWFYPEEFSVPYRKKDA